jgi:hypothetical protein
MRIPCRCYATVNTIDHWSQCKGRIIMPHPLCIYARQRLDKKKRNRGNEYTRNYWMPEQIFTKLSMYIMAYFINPSHQSVLCASPLSLLAKGSVKCIPPTVARQRLGKEKTEPGRRIHATFESLNKFLRNSDRISTAYFINPSHQSCVSVCPC